MRAVCTLTAGLSAFLMFAGLWQTGWYLEHRIPQGRIAVFAGDNKTSLRLRLESGAEVLFPKEVLWEQPQPIGLAVGDKVEKRRDSLTYLVNDKPITSFGWVLRHWPATPTAIIALVAYIALGACYSLRYGRTPLGDLCLANLTRRLGRLAVPIALVGCWVALAVVVFAIYAVLLACLGRSVFQSGHQQHVVAAARAKLSFDFGHVVGVLGCPHSRPGWHYHDVQPVVVEFLAGYLEVNALCLGRHQPLL